MNPSRGLQHLPAFRDLSLELASFNSRKLSDDGCARGAWWDKTNPILAQAVISHFLASHGQSRSGLTRWHKSAAATVDSTVVAYKGLPDLDSLTPPEAQTISGSPHIIVAPISQVPSSLLAAPFWTRQERAGTHDRKRSVS